jgi:photosystem II stability/assembly factor-like uncharacterized protein
MISARPGPRLRLLLALLACLLAGLVPLLHAQEAARKPAGAKDAASGPARRGGIPEDDPDGRSRLRALQEQSGPGLASAEARLQALTAVDALIKAQPANARTAGIPTGSRVLPQRLATRTAGLRPGSLGWAALGPDAGGRTRGIVIHPLYPNHMLLASPAGGVWVSDDGAKSWAPANDFMANLAVNCLAYDPSHPDIIYAGTGEGFKNIDSIRGLGIFRSLDAGRTWASIKVTATCPYINRIAVSPDGRTVLAACHWGYDRYKNTFDKVELWGIYRSVDAAHNNWTLCKQGGTGGFADVKFHPRNGNLAVAGVAAFTFVEQAGHAFYSTDGGNSWAQARVNPALPAGWKGGRVELTYAAANPNVVYAAVEVIEDASGKREPEARTSELWRSTDAGQSYERMAASNKADGKPANWLGRNDGQGGQGWYGNAIWAGDPTNVNFVIVGGINLWRSEDGGNSFVRISNDRTINYSYGLNWKQLPGADGKLTPTSPHADHHVIVSHPRYDGRTNRTVYFGNDGGVYGTADIYSAGMKPAPQDNNDDKANTDGWVMLNGGYCAVQFYGVAGSASAKTLLSGTQDNGTFQFVVSADGKTANWYRLAPGDGGFTAMPPDAEYLYGELPRLASIFRTGKAFNWLEGLGTARTKANDAALFIAPLVLDPNDSKRLFAGGQRLWRTNDATVAIDPKNPDSGPEWTSIKEPVADAGNISAIAVAPGNPNVIWVGHEKGHIYRTTRGLSPAAGDWEQVGQEGTSRLPMRYCTRIVFDPSNTNRVYVTYGGYFEDNIWVTNDGGSTWQNLSGSLNKDVKVPVFTLAIHPKNPTFLYIGTEAGVWASENGGRTWSVGNEGPANCRVDELIWLEQTLVAATHARGMFATDLTLIPR